MWLVNPSIKVILLLSLVFSTSSAYIKPQQVRVMVVGDIMMHSPIIVSGYDAKTNDYHYDSIFEKVKPIFSQADFVIGNLETPLAGGKAEYSGYPRFNAPKEIALALKNAEVNILTTANNHSMDQWEQGVIKTLDYLDEYDILHTGTFRNNSEKEQPLILEANGIKIGIIANTYGTNGLPVPKDKPYLVNMLDIETVKYDIERLRDQRVDYIMAMIHFGSEYQRNPNEEQMKWSEALSESGVDFILGSHPHVVQPMEIKKGDKDQSDTGIIYSLGNFLSNQTWDWTPYGIILNLLLEKDILSQKIKIKEVTVIPTYVLITREDGKRKYQIVPLQEYQAVVDKKILSNGQDLVNHVYKPN